jgi:plasmid maintenance system antidote protein VapI
MMETWRAIPGYEGRYEVSDQGRVRSLVSNSGATRRTPRIVRPAVNASGYLRCALVPTRGGKLRSHFVHRLVLQAFVGPAPSIIDAAHLNGDRTDNRLSNLAWASRRENAEHKIDHGTHGKKLTERDIAEIRRRYATGAATQPGLAEEFGVGSGHISNIVQGKKWTAARGPVSTGNNRRRRKLSEADVREIHMLRALGWSQSEIAAKFGVTRSAIAAIAQGLNWKHVRSVA